MNLIQNHNTHLVLLCYKRLRHLGITSEKGYCEGEMGVVKAKIQTVEDMYRLIWTAIANKQAISAIYKDLPRLFCPHRLGRNRLGQLPGAVLSIRRRKRERSGADRFAG